jgi:DNA polymerase III subunit gamma/tau
VSYVVLARKYRPQRFEDMVGQEHIGRTLGNAIRQDRVHHAYLFAGARGLGKTTTARIFAKALVCERGPTPAPCNECEQCIAVSESRSVDVVEIDGASNNSVDNIRQLREQVHYLPQTARRKVYIIDEVHMLTTSAFNALLKTLEEPPPHVNFVFATTEPQKVLPTILSRVSRLDFRRVSVEELVAHLQSILDREGLAVDDGGLRLIGRAAGGSVRDSLTLLDQVLAFAEDSSAVTEDEARRVLGQADNAAIAALLDAVIDHDPDELIGRFDALVSGGLDLMVLSMQVLEHLRDLVLVAVCRDPSVLRDATPGELELLRAQAGKTTPAHLGQLFDRFTRIVDRLANSRVQRLLLEMGLLELTHAEPLVPLGDLVERLRALADDEAGRGGGGSPGGGRTKIGIRGPSEPASASAGSRRAAPDARPPTPEVGSPPGPAPIAVPSASTGAAAPAPAPVREEEFGSELMKGLWNMAKGAVVPSADLAPAGTGVAGSPSPAEPEPRPRAEPASPSRTGPPEPSPETRAAGALIDLDALEEFEAFEQLVARIRDESEFASAVLRDVGLVSLRDGVLRVAAPQRSFAHTELSTRPEIRAQIEQATRDHFGNPFTLELVPGEPALGDRPSISLMEARRREEHRARIEAEARNDTRIQRLLETFNGELTGVKPLEDPPRGPVRPAHAGS